MNGSKRHDVTFDHDESADRNRAQQQDGGLSTNTTHREPLQPLPSQSPEASVAQCIARVAIQHDEVKALWKQQKHKRRARRLIVDDSEGDCGDGDEY
jgi:hypothetical protein